MSGMDETELQHLYAWIDEVPLSRPKKNIARDFSDGVMVAEVVHHFIPKLVELHNYSPASSSRQKLDNWHTLNAKVFKKLGLTVPENVVKGVVNNKAGVVEVVLSNLRVKIEQYMQRRAGIDTRDSQKTPGWGDLEPKKRRKPKKAASDKPQEQHNSFAEVLDSPAYEDIEDPVQALMDKDQSIMDYQETIEILKVKVRKMEQLVKLKDKRIDELTRKLAMYES
ncbi:sporangia induced sperm flagellar protein [Salpingoeca rosetta]|uniref:Sporangia induced sperm flagellar protein n=1 Tax=Salpingoeca rosetta (strain ATCC 50818 / BSB-021) TaxID=946362 RepID=F2TZN2_SALR5|nr:sporangia induced sperm flagellar protein [Salpingoeca rosetta]EGD79056.1 sporangia induced sperm flagellar protein [Salpingoeca rosetta]|eukprot:XP_004998012.1 sporangia induced sperm flagellar protein [Salpingoeca rosetta]